MRTEPRSTSRWPYRAALATAVAALPLVAFGGSVTTIGAGLAVEGWLEAEGHFMPLFPVEKWFRDVPTFVEHTHRLFGTLVGLFAIATVVLAFRLDGRRVARWTSVASLLAVCVQGTIGGTRVLEKSAQLAFLHGVMAQAVFALLVATAVALSPRWREAQAWGRGKVPANAPSLRAMATAAVVLVFLQAAVGAWYRHGLRNGVAADLGLRLQIHILGAFIVFGLVAGLAGRTQAAADAWSAEPRVRGTLIRTRRGLAVLLGTQLALGLFAWSSHRGGETGALEWITATAHVVCGALLLSQCVLARMWAGRVDVAAETAERVEQPSVRAMTEVRSGGVS